MKIGDEVYIHGYIDEIRKDTVIIRNDGGYFGTVLSEVTGELPSAQPEPKWIPVTERLPDISKSVLICDIDGDIYLGHRTRFGDYYPDFCDDRIKSVTAWMERPEPYKEGQDG